MTAVPPSLAATRRIAGALWLVLFLVVGVAPCFAQGGPRRPPPEKEVLDEAKELLRFDKYDEAIELLGGLCSKLEARRDPGPGLSGCRLMMGEALSAKGELGQALDMYRAALDAVENETPIKLRFELRRRIGEIWARWGDPKAALREFQAALDQWGDKVSPDHKAVVLERMGRIEQHMGNRDAAAKHFKAALDGLGGSVGSRQSIDLLLDLSVIKMRQGDVAEARALTAKARDLAHELSSGRQESHALQAMARVEIDADAPAQALPYLEEALQIARDQGRERDAADSLHLMGEANYDLNRFAEAASLLEQAAAIKERMRGQVEGETKRQYLASQIGTWNLLIDTYAQLGDAAGAFRAFEASRARFLSDTLAAAGPAAAPAAEPLDPVAFAASLPSDTAVLVTALTGRWRLRLIVLAREGVFVHRVRLPHEGAQGKGKPGEGGTMFAAGEESGEGQRGFAVTASVTATATQPSKPPASFGEELQRYRRQLTDPADAEAPARKTEARRLYDLVLGSAGKVLTGKKRLLVIPDGALALVPFETFIAPSNRYLAEDADISYANSVAVLSLLKGRSAPGGGVIAMGGAEYGGTPGKAKTYDADALAVRVDAALAAGKSLRFAYEVMGADSWPDLPGSLSEAREVAAAFPGGRLLSGPEATESSLKALARSGELGRARVLHLAVHGLAVPDVPELSALILGREPSGSAEDGFLSMREIAALDLQGGFVTLSACQTGLGRVFRGEGVVGLAQAFLDAGAGGMAVTLWSVSDASAPAFMSRAYAALGRGASFAGAFAEARRAFIRGEAGERFARPSHWAPFVVYGP